LEKTTRITAGITKETKPIGKENMNDADFYLPPFPAPAHEWALPNSFKRSAMDTKFRVRWQESVTKETPLLSTAGATQNLEGVGT